MSFPERNESSQFNIYPLETNATAQKSLFMPENIFRGLKRKKLYFQFFETSHAKNLILLKFCQNVPIDKNKKTPSLKLLDRAVLEL